MEGGTGRVVSASVLVIDSDPTLAPALQRALRAAPQRSVAVRGVSTLEEGVRAAADIHWDLVVVNLRLPDGHGLSVLDGLKRVDPQLAVLVLSEGDDDALAREAVWWGARDFVPRSASVQSIAAAVSIAVGSSRSSRLVAGMEASITALLEGYPDGVAVLHGDTGELLSRNARMDEVLGGASVEELLETAPELSVGPTPEEPLAFLTPQGEQRLLRVWRTHVEWLGRPAVALTVRDVTEALQGQQQILRLNAMLQGSRNVSRLLAQNLPVRETLRGVAQALLDTGSFAGVLFVVHRQGPRPAQVVGLGFGESLAQVEAMAEAGEPLPCQAAALEARGAALARRPAEDCETCSLARSRPGMVLLAPLRFQRHVYGFAVGSLAAHIPLAAEERELFAEIMGDLALSIHGRLAAEGERRVAQEKRQAEERLRLLFDASPSGVVFLAPLEGGEDFRVTQVNGAAERLLGRPASRMVGRRVGTLIPDADVREDVLRAARRAADGEVSVTLPARDDAGSPVLNGLEVELLRLSTDEVVALLYDVRTHLYAERMALTSLKIASSMLEGARVLLSKPRLDEALHELLRQGLRLVGCEAAAFVFYGDDDTDAAPLPVDREAGGICEGVPELSRSLIAAVRGAGVAPNVSVVREGLPGVPGAALIVGLSPVGQGASFGALVFGGKAAGFDHNDERAALTAAELASLAVQGALADEELRRSREELQGVFDNAPLGIVLTDTRGRIEKVNARLREWFPEAVVGAQVPGWDRPDAFEGKPFPAALTAVDGLPHEHDMVVPGEPATRRYHVSAGALRGADGSLEALIVLFDDVTAREHDREMSVRSQSLMSLGLLSTGIAHEVNNPLTSILLNARKLAQELPAVVRGVLDLRSTFGMEDTLDLPASARALLGRRGLEDLVRMAEETVEGGEYVEAIVTGLLQFAKVGAVTVGPFKVSDAVERAVKMTREDVRGVARLEREVPPGLWAVGATAQLVQVLVALIRNASQAIGEGEPDEHLIRIRAMGVDGEVWVVVSDTGPGMPANVAAHIFEPFFTTKGAAGTGMGLYIAHNIVQAMGGTLELDTSPGRGTRFTIQLKATSEADARTIRVGQRGVSSPPRTTAGQKGVGRAEVLVIDDDALVARSIARQLSSDFDVTIALSGQEGLGLIMERPDRFDAILCDFLLGDLDGVDVWQAVEGLDPGLTRRILYLTGAAAVDRAGKFARDMEAPFIQKPPNVAELIETVALVALVARERP